ncbi:MAG: hypothetical protein WC099_01840 [Candidatus Paceibacterota bacterium]
MYTKFFIIAVIGAAIIGGGLAFIIGSDPSPQTLLSDALQNISTAKVIEATAGLEAAWSGSKSSLFSQKGRTSSTSQEKQIVSGNLSASITQLLSFESEQQKQIKTNVSIHYTSSDMEKPIQVQVEAIGTIEKFYVREQGVQDALVNLGLPIPLTGIENTWIEIAPTAVAENPLLKDASTTITVEVEQKFDLLNKRNAILNILKKYQIVKQMDVVGTEMVGTHNTYHIKTVLDENEARRAFREIRQQFSEKASSTEMQQDNKTHIKSLDVWIDVASHEFRAITILFNPNTLVNEVDKEKTKDLTVQNFDIKIRDMKYNEPFTFTPPSSARKLEDVFGEIMQGLFGGIMNEKKP